MLRSETILGNTYANEFSDEIKQNIISNTNSIILILLFSPEILQCYFRNEQFGTFPKNNLVCYAKKNQSILEKKLFYQEIYSFSTFKTNSFTFSLISFNGSSGT